jgi:hypothetical protein
MSRCPNTESGGAPIPDGGSLHGQSDITSDNRHTPPITEGSAFKLMFVDFDCGSVLIIM